MLARTFFLPLLSSLAVLIALLQPARHAGVAGVLGASAVFPLDMAKTRLQNQTVSLHFGLVFRSPFFALCLRALPSRFVQIIIGSCGLSQHQSLL